MTTPLPTTTSSPERPAASAPSRRESAHRLRTHLLTPVSLTLTSIPLLLSTFISGLADAAAYNAWSAFVSMQTGNTVFLALGASGQPLSRPYGWLRSLTSILAFMLGCAFFARFMRALGHDGRTRAALAASFAIQAVMMLVAAGLATGKVVPTPAGDVSPPADPPDFLELLPLGLLAFQAGGQIVASRMLGHIEIPTTVLTSVYCDLTSDARAMSRENAVRDRRVAAVVLLLTGGIVGGWISRSEAGLGTVLWVGGGLKCLIVGAWLWWTGERVEERGKGIRAKRGW
ncbi:hypothetical protein MMC13_007970 [Lambiella insularis]|nr:hypothetical protein [Lambiella insularis]